VLEKRTKQASTENFDTRQDLGSSKTMKWEGKISPHRTNPHRMKALEMVNTGNKPYCCFRCILSCDFFSISPFFAPTLRTLPFPRSVRSVRPRPDHTRTTIVFTTLFAWR